MMMFGCKKASLRRLDHTIDVNKKTDQLVIFEKVFPNTGKQLHKIKVGPLPQTPKNRPMDGSIKDRL